MSVSTLALLFDGIDCLVRIDCSGIAGYSLFGRTVDSDILVSFPRDDTPIVVGRVAISFVASVSYPCIHFASRYAVTLRAVHLLLSPMSFAHIIQFYTDNSRMRL
jgi:hypothetical protein